MAGIPMMQASSGGAGHGIGADHWAQRIELERLGSPDCMTAAALRRTRKPRAQWSRWMTKYSKHYPSPKEREKRYQIFKSKTNSIGTFASQTVVNAVVSAFASQIITEATVGMNRFGDLVPSEFVEQFAGFNSIGVRAPPPFALPADTWELCCVVWRSSGTVTGVKFLGSCLSCRAFAAVAKIEGLNKIRTGELVSLSEQELVDCNTKSSGCAGSRSNTALGLVVACGGITSEEKYPYSGFKGSCDVGKLLFDHQAFVNGFKAVLPNDGA